MPVPPTDTVTVRADETAEAAVAVTVTDVPDAPSLTLDGNADSVTAGYSSSSVSVTVVPVTDSLVPVPDKPIVSLPSTVESSVGVSVKAPVPVVALAPMAMSRFDTAA